MIRKMNSPTSSSILSFLKSTYGLRTEPPSLTMEKTIAVFTIFTFLLFTFTTARIALDPFAIKPSTESVAVAVADSNEVLSIENSNSGLDQTSGNYRFPESENTQTIDVSSIDQTPRLRFARSHPIKRHFFDKTTRFPLRFVRRHPCRKFQQTFIVPQTKRSYGNDMILSSKTYNFDPKTIGDQVPTEWLEFKHKYGHHHHHHDDKNEEIVPKFMFNKENMVRSSHHHKEKREHEGGFMRRFRKFLKHTFD
ncbi:hypothetical protein L1887_29259 [Cichorium endivia]|nr:hypothetical protein L1887_29259 [Cichorium endivia]